MRRGTESWEDDAHDLENGNRSWWYSNIPPSLPIVRPGEEEEQSFIGIGGIGEHPSYLYDGLCNGYSDNEGEFMFSNNGTSPPLETKMHGEWTKDRANLWIDTKWKRVISVNGKWQLSMAEKNWGNLSSWFLWNKDLELGIGIDIFQGRRRRNWHCSVENKFLARDRNWVKFGIIRIWRKKKFILYR